MQEVCSSRKGASNMEGRPESAIGGIGRRTIVLLVSDAQGFCKQASERTVVNAVLMETGSSERGEKQGWH